MKNLRPIFFLLLSGFTSSIFAQQGTIRGVVIDNETGESLIGVNVVVQGTSIGGSTDLDGNFNIKVKEGEHSIIASYISYANAKIEKIHVKQGEITNVGTIRLKVDAIQTQTVVVEATQSRNNATAMVTIQKKSANVMDAVSAQTFKKSGDSDAGAAIKRVTGVSVEGGKYVYVRGLGDRYTKTTLNGMEIPGLDPDRNSIQLDLFPTNLIDNISIYKSFSPELAGDFTGGVVDIITKDFPDEKNANISISLGYTPNMNFNSNFLSYQSGASDYLAFGAKQREIPFDRSTKLQPSLYIVNPELVAEKTAQFENNMATTRKLSLLNSSISYGFGNQQLKDSINFGLFKAKGLTIGYNFALSYSQNSTFYDDIEFSDYITNPEISKYELIKARQDSGEVGIEETFWSAYASGSIKKKNYSLSLGLTHLQNGTKQASLLNGFKSSLGGDQEAVLQKHVLYYNQRSITNLLLSAKKSMPEKNLEITFKSAPTLALNKEPDFVQNVFNIEDDKVYISGGGLPVSQRLFRNLKEYSLGNKVDAKWEFKQWSGEKAILIGGVAYTYKNRDFNILTYKFREIRRRDNYTLDPNEILAANNLYNVAPNDSGIIVSGFEQPNNNYQSNSSNLAAYIQNELPISSVFKAVYGLRMEKYIIRYTGQRQVVLSNEDIFDNEKVLDEFNFLPSLGLIYQLSEDVNLRANFSQTVARPSFKEKSGAEIVDALSGRTFIGNLDVKQTEINNYDIRLERFYDGGQLISLSGFYKKLNNPIEIVAFDQTATDQFTPRNSKEATLYGIELDARRNLSFLIEELSQWSVGLNITLVKSGIDRREMMTPGGDGVIGTFDDISEYDERVQNKRDGEEVSKFRPLQGQSPYVVNAFINYQLDSIGLNAMLSYNVQGKRLAVVGISNSPNVYEQPFHSLNFKTSKTLGINGNSSVSFAVDNLLGDKRERFFESYNADSQIYSSFSPNRTFSIGYSYKF